MRRLIWTLFLFISVLMVSAQSIPVPAAYQDLYSAMSSQISAFDSAIHTNWSGAASPVIYAPLLGSASAAEYAKLLAPNYYNNVVLPQLEELKALGAEGVKVQISFPILYAPFYSSPLSQSAPPQYQAFVNFYQQLIKDVHARGMKLIVESIVGNAFPGDDAAPFAAYYQSLSWNTYMAARAQNALNTALLIQPDSMSVITEPDSEASYTGQPNAGTVAGSTQLLKTILAALENAGVTRLPIGAGAGTWLGSFTQFIQSFTALPLAYIDMHVFPVNHAYLTNALSGADLAHAAGKQVAVSETWAYKVRDSELGKISLVDVAARDPFSFWEPLDQAFLKAMVDFANAKHLMFLSPFWSHYFAAYLDYASYGSLSSSQIILDGQAASGTAAQAGSFSPTGLAWMRMTTPAADVAPPLVPSAPAASSVAPTSMWLSWPPATDNTGVAGYRLYRNNSLIATTSLLAFYDQKLTPGATYTYQLSAFDASGNVSPLSVPLTVETIDTTPPTVPAKLAVSKIGSTSVSLSWSASSGIGGVGGYVVLRGTSASSMKGYAKTTATSYADSICSPSTTYYYAAESYNPLGYMSAASAAVSAKTAARAASH